MNKPGVYEFSWVGSQENFIDKINIHKLQHIVLGRFGGNKAAGQIKNEDGCVIWVDEKKDWEFVILLDAHQTAESAEFVISAFETQKEVIKNILSLSINESFDRISELILTIFKSKRFKEACQNIQGETACLFAVRKGKFLWWLSIGDCVLYLFHPELSVLNEYQQNHRSFYEWVGRVNTFDLPVPCYCEGRKELRKGKNHLFLTTDGLIECPNTDFKNPKEILKSFEIYSNDGGVKQLLQEIQEKNVRDSTTIISWFVEIESDATLPSM
ncbi:protein phosphatase 2C domain-containing protein [Bacillus sp. DTU_2020_1000418_1_SI_GHA_SEK_038]|uniref:protein phosphatase 2C domain-containing protein n=1 Tax=Bacillus sp. DTU_2020_1000418_1_SI_GHA_SEK_038 TaxID=3077585 RepID=UPI0028EB2112|nr:protein phosphatase 2C domain-containing protein [Bacillus sp. DTU_2020_1000418_1_SI_GHA_SEK_038]WNS74785.1 protein phosphatase 2C domain-containing protein [Bacillus sp. DTU_2020_1000418_1_SI_GHA_SEK_038]